MGVMSLPTTPKCPILYWEDDSSVFQQLSFIKNAMDDRFPHEESKHCIAKPQNSHSATRLHHNDHLKESHMYNILLSSEPIQHGPLTYTTKFLENYCLNLCLLQDIAETFTVRMSRMGHCRDIA